MMDVKTKRQRISQLEQLIPMKMKRVSQSKPTDFNYLNWVNKLEEYQNEYKRLTGKNYELRWER